MKTVLLPLLWVVLLVAVFATINGYKLLPLPIIVFIAALIAARMVPSKRKNFLELAAGAACFTVLVYYI